MASITTSTEVPASPDVAVLTHTRLRSEDVEVSSPFSVHPAGAPAEVALPIPAVSNSVSPACTDPGTDTSGVLVFVALVALSTNEIEPLCDPLDTVTFIVEVSGAPSSSVTVSATE